MSSVRRDLYGLVRSNPFRAGMPIAPDRWHRQTGHAPLLLGPIELGLGHTCGPSKVLCLRSSDLVSTLVTEDPLSEDDKDFAFRLEIAIPPAFRSEYAAESPRSPFCLLRSHIELDERPYLRLTHRYITSGQPINPCSCERNVLQSRADLKAFSEKYAGIRH